MSREEKKRNLRSSCYVLHSAPHYGTVRKGAIERYAAMDRLYKEIYDNGHEVGADRPVRLTFSTKGHSGTVVPVFAYGRGAEEFSGVMKNIDIPARIEALIYDKKGNMR